MSSSILTEYLSLRWQNTSSLSWQYIFLKCEKTVCSIEKYYVSGQHPTARHQASLNENYFISAFKRQAPSNTINADAKLKEAS